MKIHLHLRRALATPLFWLCALIFWAITLFLLSKLSTVPHVDSPEIPHLDKIVHYAYFMSGAFFLTTHILLNYGNRSHPTIRILFPIFFFAVAGALDEYHQTFTPGRSGNDPFDWLADFLGVITGTFLAHYLHPLLLIISNAPSDAVKD